MRVYQRYPAAHFINFAYDKIQFLGEPRGDCDIANDAVINDATIDITGGVYIGPRVHFGHQVMVLTGSHPTGIFNGLARRKALNLKPVRINADAYIGTRALILPGVVIGAAAYIAAGAVVTRDVAPKTLVGGNPAKIIRQL